MDKYDYIEGEVQVTIFKDGLNWYSDLCISHTHAAILLSVLMPKVVTRKPCPF